ncbi:pseudaminic acid cytidylyltransferase [uncultured Parabacteroides sp.]|uniref:pseudaminic acid cytidylyltransferase n=1 Tax=uncultured Parabacteroides sp. TaxID=512312 RepID=UPI0025E4147C|nr:pseudaminic acid cytidylyltransferase [uncultured Parabacteroides sp.]
MKNIAIIPARGGSKRIPRKNIKPFWGRPIVSYSIESALKSDLFHEVMVSTDDPEIVQVAQEFGASVPFLRSSDTANDFASLSEVLLEVLDGYEKNGMCFDNICCILPTAPLITEENIKAAYSLLKDSSFDSVCPVVAFSYPILRSLSFDENRRLQMNWPEYRFARSQDLKPAYHDSGTFYWIKTEVLQKDKKLLSDNGTAIIMEEFQVQDIDTYEDWALAEMKYRLLHNL